MTETTTRSTKKRAKPRGTHCDACKVTVEEPLQEVRNDAGVVSNVCGDCFRGELARRHALDADKEAAAAAVVAAADQVDDQVDEDADGDEDQDGDAGDEEEKAAEGEGGGEGEVSP